MSIGMCVARAFCVIVTVGVAGAFDPARAEEAVAGFVLERLSKGHVHVWRAIDQGREMRPTHPESHALPPCEGCGNGPEPPPTSFTSRWSPRSRWRRGESESSHVEHVDPAGLRHVAVIRLCPRNIELARTRPAPDAINSPRPLRRSHRYREIRGGAGSRAGSRRVFPREL